jgi:hypothetical protein
VPPTAPRRRMLESRSPRSRLARGRRCGSWSAGTRRRRRHDWHRLES